MTIPLPLVLAVLGLIVSAKTKYHGIPVLWLIAAAVVLGLFAMVLILVRLLVREFRPVTA